MMKNVEKPKVGKAVINNCICNAGVMAGEGGLVCVRCGTLKIVWQ